MLNKSIYRRTYTRKPLSIDVQLKFKGEKLGHTLTRNVNFFGAFIDLDKHGLVTNDFVEIYFTDNDNKCVVQKGMVMHYSKEGVGVIFAYHTDEFRSMLAHKMMGLTTAH
jgi:hypothetical protein